MEVLACRPRALPGGQQPFRLHACKAQPNADLTPAGPLTPRLTPSSVGSPGARRFSFNHCSPLPGRRSAKIKPSLRPALQRFADALAVNDAMVALDMVSDALEAGAGASVTKDEFRIAVEDKRRHCPELFVEPINRAIANIHAEHFQAECTDFLPTHVMQYVLSFLQLEEHPVLCCLSQAWRTMSEADCLWLSPYLERFRFHDPQSALRQGLAKHDYARRLKDPARGDRVEVAWRGKFRLESLEIYNGLAWWVAEVVDKGPNGRYRVHYPGWEERWDEWVPRARLRWGNERRAKQLAGHKPAPGDLVEMWCGGVHVPGAWLEATVRSVKDDRLYLGEVLTTGHFWAETKKVRLVRTARSGDKAGDGAAAAESGASGPAAQSPMCPSFRLAGAGGGGGGCAVM